jgi:hypothetical protein
MPGMESATKSAPYSWWQKILQIAGINDGRGFYKKMCVIEFGCGEAAKKFLSFFRHPMLNLQKFNHHPFVCV